ncbi:MAG TPA: DMT family transporter [Candidatus Limnocylindrales bacterium]|nr:DMT family transporter [Candidatus Limnocylindrales bacterium]
MLLVGVTAVWGWTFVVVKDAVSHYPVLSFLGLRFALAAAVLWVIVRLARVQPAAAPVGLGIGAVLAIGYLTQTLGLQRTTIANTGLITGLFVVFTPILDRVLFGVPTRRWTWIAVLLAFAGTGLLTGAAPGGLHPGDLLVLCGSVAFALHIALLSRYSTRSPVGLAAWQMSAAAALLLLGTIGTRASVWPMPGGVPAALVITGVFASAVAFWVQTWAQQRLEATRAAIILTMEPAFTVAFAFWLAGERFRILQAVGAVLILVALFGNEAWERRPLGAAAPVEIPLSG